MNSQITEAVREDICARAARLDSEKELGSAILAGLQNADIDWRDVGLEETKSLLMDAILCFRQQHDCAVMRLAS